MRLGKNAVCTQTKGLYYKVINKNCGGKIFSCNLRESGCEARTESEKPQHFLHDRININLLPESYIYFLTAL